MGPCTEPGEEGKEGELGGIVPTHVKKKHDLCAARTKQVPEGGDFNIVVRLPCLVLPDLEEEKSCLRTARIPNRGSQFRGGRKQGGPGPMSRETRVERHVEKLNSKSTTCHSNKATEGKMAYDLRWPQYLCPLELKPLNLFIDSLTAINQFLFLD